MVIASRYQVRKERPAGSNFAEQAMLQQSTDLVAYWRLDNRPSGVAEELVQTSANLNGAFSLANFNRDDRSPAGLSCLCFDGSTTTIDLYSAALNTAMSWDEFSVSLWFRIGAFTDWQTAALARILYIAADGDNYVSIAKSATPDVISFAYAGAATADSVAASAIIPDTGASPTKWMSLILTVSDSDNDSQLKAYVNGVQAGSTQTGIGVWSGAIDSDLCVVGSSALAIPADQISSGSLVSDVALWNTVLTPGEVEVLANLK